MKEKYGFMMNVIGQGKW